MEYYDIAVIVIEFSFLIKLFLSVAVINMGVANGSNVVSVPNYGVKDSENVVWKNSFGALVEVPIDKLNAIGKAVKQFDKVAPDFVEKAASTIQKTVVLSKELINNLDGSVGVDVKRQIESYIKFSKRKDFAGSGEYRDMMLELVKTKKITRMSAQEYNDLCSYISRRCVELRNFRARVLLIGNQKVEPTLGFISALEEADKEIGLLSSVDYNKVLNLAVSEKSWLPSYNDLMSLYHPAFNLYEKLKNTFEDASKNSSSTESS